MAFFRHIREAAAHETDDAGTPPSLEQQLVVFPGLELTVAVPCQALLILDVPACHIEIVNVIDSPGRRVLEAADPAVEVTKQSSEMLRAVYWACERVNGLVI